MVKLSAMYFGMKQKNAGIGYMTQNYSREAKWRNEMTTTTIYEPVEFRYIRPNGVFYLDNPRDNKNTLPHYACENFPPNQIVWTVYFGWQVKNPWVIKEYFVENQAGNQAAGLINSLGSDWF